jgi:hypothetical protein
MAAINAEDLVKALERQGKPIPRELADQIHPNKQPAKSAPQAAQGGYWPDRYDDSWFSAAWRWLGITIYATAVSAGRLAQSIWRWTWTRNAGAAGTPSSSTRRRKTTR